MKFSCTGDRALKLHVHCIPKFFQAIFELHLLNTCLWSEIDLHNLQCTSNADILIVFVRNAFAVSKGKTQRQA